MAPSRPTKEQLAAAAGKTLRDVIAPGLRVLFVGINPSLYSAAVGHHFARPGNRFWPALHRSGFTERLLRAEEDASLLERGIGITNVVARATAQAAELDPDELRAGARALERKVRRYRPAIVAFLGLDAYRVAFGERRATVGEQPRRLGSARVWVLPNPSGLNASYQIDRIAALFREVLAATADAGAGLIDISRAIANGMPVWPGDPPVRVRALRGGTYRVSEISMGTHAGTHVDAPSHLPGHAAGVDVLPLDALVGEAVVVDAAGALDDVPAAPRVLLRTGGNGWLTEAGARAAVARDVRLIGTDAASIDAVDATDLPAHRILLGAGIVVVESLDLSGASPGRYRLVCLPLKIRGADGAPARAILLPPEPPADGPATVKGGPRGDR